MKRLTAIAFALIFVFSGCIHIPGTLGSSNFFQKENLYDSIVKVENSIRFEICDIQNGGIENCKEKSEKFSVGSGFAIGKNYRANKIGTAGHVCELTDNMKARMRMKALFTAGKWLKNLKLHSHEIITDNGKEMDADVVEANKGLDACLLSIKGKTLPALHIASEGPERGHRYYSAGAPLGVNGKEMTYLTSGLYSGTKKIGVKNFDWYSIPSTGGSSGSAILNENGAIVGIITRGTGGFQEISIGPVYSKVHWFFTKHI